ncbi:MAG: hypothetical protein FP824_10955 [Euryarchaeota archaeon]|nr:hypothetical protein [Euryarchaeota archaeon]
MKIGELNYIHSKSVEEEVIGAKRGGLLNSQLSPLTLEIMQNALLGKVTLVFSQGPLHLTPVLCVLLQVNNERDILVGIPRNIFKKRMKEYKDIYYSLRSRSIGFFYKKYLLCEADVNKSGEIKISLEGIKTKPKWGLRHYKDGYEELFIKGLFQGGCEDWPKIIGVPIDYNLPENLLKTRNFFYEKDSLLLSPFNPKFVILESVNERIYSFEIISKIIENLNNNGIGGIIHFSWPYLPGLNEFLKDLEDKTDKVSIIHIGKRYGIEMRESFNKYLIETDPLNNRSYKMNDFIRSRHSFRTLSLEGSDWNRYYPEPIKFSELKNIEVFMVGTLGPHEHELADIKAQHDLMISDIRYEINQDELPTKFRSLIAFPPFIDSFLKPSEITISIANKEGEYKSLPIKEALIEKFDKKRSGLSNYLDLCTQFDKSFDVVNHMRGLHTPNFMSKNSILYYLILQEIISERLSTNEKSDIIICDYVSQLGAKKKIQNNIISMLEYLKKNKSPDDIYLRESQFFTPINMRKKSLEPRQNIVKAQIEDIFYTLNKSKQKMEIKANLIIGERKISKSITILLTDIHTLNRNLPEDYTESILLLPGPIPILSFKKDNPAITRGFDILLRPFRKIIFLTYSGDNFNKLCQQCDIIDSLVGENSSNEIAQKDYAISATYMPEDLFVKIKGKSCVDFNLEIPKSELTDENPLDTAIRRELMDNMAQQPEKHEFNHLVDIWKSVKSIKEKKTDSTENLISDYSIELTKLTVLYLNRGVEEMISLNSNGFIRKISDDGTIYILAKELQPGDEFIYWKATDKQSLDNYFINSYSEFADWSLEEILGVYRCIADFIEAIQSIDRDSIYNHQLETLYWLTEEQKFCIFNLIKYLLSNTDVNTIEDINEITEKWKKVLGTDECIWNDLANLPEDEISNIKYDFESGRSYISYSKLLPIVKHFGWNLADTTFNALLSSICSKSININEQKKPVKYFFREYVNLYALGKLIGNQNIIDRYEEINEAGFEIWKILELVGHSIYRVREGKDNPFNEMDQMIKERMSICKVISNG